MARAERNEDCFNRQAFLKGEILGVTLSNASGCLKSKNAKGSAIMYSLNGNQVKVWCAGDASIFSGN